MQLGDSNWNQFVSYLGSNWDQFELLLLMKVGGRGEPDINWYQFMLSGASSRMWVSDWTFATTNWNQFVVPSWLLVLKLIPISAALTIQLFYSVSRGKWNWNQFHCLSHISQTRCGRGFTVFVRDLNSLLLSAVCISAVKPSHSHTPRNQGLFLVLAYP